MVLGRARVYRGFVRLLREDTGGQPRKIFSGDAGDWRWEVFQRLRDHSGDTPRQGTSFLVGCFAGMGHELLRGECGHPHRLV